MNSVLRELSEERIHFLIEVNIVEDSWGKTEWEDDNWGKLDE